MRMWPVRGESTRVAQTGQKQCYDVSGMPIPVRHRAGRGIQVGVPWPNPRFTDNGDGTVTDNLTGLIWLKNATPFWDQDLGTGSERLPLLGQRQSWPDRRQ